jgi:hypothetical protein
LLKRSPAAGSFAGIESHERMTMAGFRLLGRKPTSASSGCTTEPAHSLLGLVVAELRSLVGKYAETTICIPQPLWEKAKLLSDSFAAKRFTTTSQYRVDHSYRPRNSVFGRSPAYDLPSCRVSIRNIPRVTITCSLTRTAFCGAHERRASIDMDPLPKFMSAL